MMILTIPRATVPHGATLATMLAPLLAAANAGSFHVRYQGGAVQIEQESFAGVDQPAVAAAVAAAPVSTPSLEAQSTIDGWPPELKALFLLLVDQLNILRTQPTTVLAAITVSQAWAAVKAKAATL